MSRPERTLESLNLNVEEAMQGRHWLLLPEGFRHQEAGKDYPLPSSTEDLQKLIVIPVQPNRRDAGTVYLKRALMELKRRLRGRSTKSGKPIEYTTDRVQQAGKNFNRDLNNIKEQAREALADVQREAERAIASMHDLFALGRQGLEGQMKSHLEQTPWQGETIDARAFRECFRMVSQTVRGLGLPSDENRKAREAIIEELAASLRATQEAIELAPTVVVIPEGDGKTEH